MTGSIPHVKCTVANVSDKPLLQKACGEIAAVARPDWSAAGDNPWSVEVFTEGITNIIFSFWPASAADADDRIVVKLYGVKTELLIDRQEEIACMQKLHKHDCGPPAYCTFENGMAYGFVPGRTLDMNDVIDPSIYPLIARQMVKMHNIDYSAEAKSQLCDNLSDIIDKIPEHFSSKELQAKFDAGFPGDASAMFRKELDEMVKVARSLKCPIAFSHTDLLLKNIILSKSNDRVTFIDYEYTQLAPVVYDIVDHFIEFAGINDPDFEAHFPGDEFQLSWIRHYLQSWHDVRSLPPPSDADVKQLFVEVNRYAPYPHLYWSVWGLLQANYSKIDFDYMEYSILRMKEYRRLKDRADALFGV